MSFLGKHHTNESKAKIGDSHIGKHHTDEARYKLSLAMKGKQTRLGSHCTKEHKAKLSAVMKGNQNAVGSHRSQEARAKVSVAHVGHSLSQEHRGKISVAVSGEKNPWYGKHHSVESRIKMSKTRLALFQDPIFKERAVAAVLKTTHTRPNRAELKLQSILDRCLPNMWKYVGNGELIIGGHCPDFVNTNGRKEVIELFGTYWHNLFDIAKKKAHYHKFGFKVAIIWEDELKNEKRLLVSLKRRLR